MRIGMVLQRPSKDDRRNLELTISPKTRKAYKRKELLLGSK